ncbi:DUF4291 family protein [Streptosporangium sp. V21-05]|uniref:DUF4291 family protein n=1 Tax=Streptosporangium sp. V21-05 TaxID=3446115 RepID=UPI003F52A331
MEEPKHGIRAVHSASTITVYQAYAPEIGLPAAHHGRFPAAWKRDRMTWIKPSFLWMTYRCGWGTEEGQETVLAIEIRSSQEGPHRWPAVSYGEIREREDRRGRLGRRWSGPSSGRRRTSATIRWGS